MPELPEVETTRRGIRPYVKEQRVTKVVIRQPKLRWPIPESIYTLQDQMILDVQRRSKYLLLNSPKGTAIIHLGMSGSLRITEADEAPRKHDHFDFSMENNKILRYHDPRRFGALLWTEEPIATHPLITTLGPEPLSTQFDGKHLFKATRKRRIAIKNLIMNSHIVVGVGNIYASESLFLAGIRPGIAAGRLTQQQCHHLCEHIKAVLSRAITQGGTTLKDFVNPDSTPGYFAQSLNVYGRTGQPCLRCDTPIKQKQIAQRSSFYCPQCQQ